MPAQPTTIIISGSRNGHPDFEDAFYHSWEAYLSRGGSEPDLWLHGAARGVDTAFANLAPLHAPPLPVLAMPADWDHDGKSAGFKRNERMLTHGHTLAVLAFKEGFDKTLSRGGTEHMVKVARAAGVPCFITSGDHRFLWK